MKSIPDPSDTSPARADMKRAWYPLRRRRCCLLILAILATSMMDAVLVADIGYTRPDPKANGGLHGTIATARTLQEVVALEPYEGKVYRGTIDDQSGSFRFVGLPPGEYDLIIKTVGHVYEGVTLDFESEDKLERKELQAICDEMAQVFFKTEDFFNRKHIVRLYGGPKRLRMFVTQTRTKPVVDPGGKPIRAYIRRFDVVEMVKTRRVWQITTSRHVLRQEVQHGSKDIKLEFRYSPKLSRLLVGKKVRDLVRIELEKLPKEPKGSYFASAKHAAK